MAKTSVKCSWLEHPKSARPKEVKTIGEHFPLKKPEFRFVSLSVSIVKFFVTLLMSVFLLCRIYGISYS